MKVDYVLLGKRIRSLRKKHKLTQEQFAELIDRSSAFVGHIERGTRKPSVETLCEIAVKMNCSMDELLGLELQKVDRYACARELLTLAQALAHGGKTGQVQGGERHE